MQQAKKPKQHGINRQHIGDFLMTTIVDEPYGKVIYRSGESVYDSVKTIEAIPSDGYKFMMWHTSFGYTTKNPLIVEYNDSLTEKRATAYFIQDITYCLNIKSCSNGTAIVQDTDQPSHKKAIATADDGYIFSHWVGDYVTNENKSDNPLDIWMNQDKSTAYVCPMFVNDDRYTILTMADGSIKNILVNGTFSLLDACGWDINNGNREKLKEVTLGSIVKVIDTNAFANCTQLDKITSKNKINVSNLAFNRCGFTEFDFSKLNGKTIEFQAFSYTNIHRVDGIPSSILVIEPNCFYNCQDLSTVIIPSTVRTIGFGCFRKCNSLVDVDMTSFTNEIPHLEFEVSLKSQYVFDDDASLSIRFNSINESTLAFSDDHWKVFSDYIYPKMDEDIPTILDFQINKKSTVKFKVFPNKEKSNISVDFGDQSSILKVWIDSGSKVIPYTYKKAGIYHATISNTLSSISNVVVNNGNYASIQQLGSKITYLPRYAFDGLTITQFQIPRTIMKIDNPLMSKLVKTDIDDLPDISAKNGAKISHNWIVLLNGDLVNLFGNQYETEFNATGIKILKHLTMHCFSHCRSLTSIHLPKSVQKASLPLISSAGMRNLKTLTIENDAEFDVQNGMLVSNDGQICLTVRSPSPPIIPTIAKSIGSRAFTNTTLTKITIPSNIQHIDKGAFCNNYDLTSLIFSDMSNSDVEKNMEQSKWIYGGVDAQTEYDDEKLAIKHITIQCSNRQQLDCIAITDQYGYVNTPLSPDKVRCLTVTNEYGNKLVGMTNDSDRLEQLLNGYASTIVKLKNTDATKDNVVREIKSFMKTMHEDELFIFHVGGYDRAPNTEQSVVFYNNSCLNADDLWELIKNAKCRVLAIFGTVSQDKTDPHSSWIQSASNFIEKHQSKTRLCVYCPCEDYEDTAYMMPNVGHNLITSLIRNYDINDGFDTYQSLFDNATTANEPSRSKVNGKSYVPVDNITPTCFAFNGFDMDARAFT